MLSKLRVPAARVLTKTELSLVLTTDFQIKKLNKYWRKKNKATDVLSFPQFTVQELTALPKQSKKNKIWYLGDIVISLTTAKKQAKEFGHSVQEELLRLLVHGLLHLLGYDHEISAKEERRMQRLEKRLLTKLLE